MGTRLARALLALTLVGAGAACAAPVDPARPAGPIDPSFEPAFQVLRTALEEGDEPLAERVLARILARAPEGATLAHAEAYGRILAGRALVGSLDLGLVAHEESPGGPLRVALVARHGGDVPLRLRGGAASLRLLSTGLDVGGVEERLSQTRSVPVLDDFTIPPGEDLRLDLVEVDVPTGLALGVRTSFDLTLPPGTINAGAGDLPAMRVAVRGCEVQRLAPWLPSGPVEPAELARFVEEGQGSRAALIERTVRIAPARREEALDLLTPILLRGSRPELAPLVPTLRWLSEERDLGADTEAWWRWLEARAAPLAPADEPAGEPGGVLDLPETSDPGDATVPPGEGDGR